MISWSIAERRSQISHSLILTDFKSICTRTSDAEQEQDAGHVLLSEWGVTAEDSREEGPFNAVVQSAPSAACSAPDEKHRDFENFIIQSESAITENSSWSARNINQCSPIHLKATSGGSVDIKKQERKSDTGCKSNRGILCDQSYTNHSVPQAALSDATFHQHEIVRPESQNVVSSISLNASSASHPSASQPSCTLEKAVVRNKAVAGETQHSLSATCAKDAPLLNQRVFVRDPEEANSGGETMEPPEDVSELAADMEVKTKQKNPQKTMVSAIRFVEIGLHNSDFSSRHVLNKFVTQVVVAHLQSISIP